MIDLHPAVVNRNYILKHAKNKIMKFAKLFVTTKFDKIEYKKNAILWQTGTCLLVIVNNSWVIYIVCMLDPKIGFEDQ